MNLNADERNRDQSTPSELSRTSMTGNNALEITSNLTPILEKKVKLFDLDGTIWLGKQMLTGSVDTLSGLREKGDTTVFFTNNSSKSRTDYFTKLLNLDVCASPDEVVMSTDTVIRYLQARQVSSAYIMGTTSMKSMMADHDITHTSDPKSAQYVVIAFDMESTAQKLTEVARLVASGTPYIVAHPDPFCPSEDGPIVDCGSYYACIKTATGVEAEAVLGKPSEDMVRVVEERFQASREDMIIFGDRLYTDIAMGTNAGIDTVLVLSGENSIADIAQSPYKPTHILNSVADLLPALGNT